MGLQKYIGSQTFKSQIRNGTLFNDNPQDFTTFFQANVGEFVEARTSFYFRWFSEATEFNTINVQQGQLTFNGGDFETDGWSVGDTFDAAFLNTQTATPVVFSGTVTAVAGNLLIFNLTAGAIPNAVEVDGGAMTGTNILDAAIFKYNLIENSNPADYNSLIDGEPNQFFASGLSNPIDTDVTATPSLNGVNRTFENGVINIRNRGPAQNGFQEFLVTHTFYVLPYYLSGYSANYLNGTLPTLFQGNNSLKYIVELDARPSQGNANASKIVSSTEQLGNVGFFDESFNGFPNNFVITNFAYAGSTALNPVGTNTITATIQNNGVGASFQNGDNFTVSFSRLVDPNNYIPNSRYVDTFLVSKATTFIQNLVPISSNIIQNVSGSLDGNGDLVINFECNFTQPQYSNQLLPEEDYIIWIEVGSNGLTNNSDDRVALLADYNQFLPANDVPGLVGGVEMQQGIFANIYNHNEQISNGYGPDVYDSFNGMVEDGYLFNTQIALNQSRGAEITGMSFNLIARNSATNDEFLLNTYNFDLSSSLLINATAPFTGQEQFLQLNSSRGFNLSANDQFNFANISTLPMEQIGTDSFSKFDIQVGFKLGWETWIANPDVNIVFFDQTKPNNNLNYRQSNYSELQGYEIIPRFDLVVYNRNSFIDTNGIFYEPSSTLYKVLYPKGIVRDYGDDSDPKGQAPIHQCDIETFKLSDGNSTSGAILTSEDTKVRARFTRIDGQAIAFQGFSGAIRIDIQNGGLFSIEELSTLAANVPISNGLLKPIGQNTRTQVDVDPGGLFVDLICKVDHTQMVDGANYVLSSRLWADDEVQQVGQKRMENDTNKLMEDGTQKFVE